MAVGRMQGIHALRGFGQGAEERRDVGHGCARNREGRRDAMAARERRTGPMRWA